MNNAKAQTIKIVASIVLMLTPSVSFAQANAHMLAGINAQTGTSYTIQVADQIKLTTFNNPNPVAVTLPAATTPNFGAGTLFSVRNLGVGLVTITVTSGFIDGTSTLSLGPGQGADIYSDGANYVSQKGTGANLSGMVFNQVPIATNSTTVTSSKPIQGVLDANILGAGTITGVTQPLCTDANGGATTVGCPSGGGAAPAAPNFQAQVYNSGNLASTPCFNVSTPSSSTALGSLGCDMSTAGPNPNGVDIRTRGARICDIRFAPCAVGDTATISLGSPTTATVSAAHFINGDGIVFTGAGPTSMSTAPTGLAAVQSVAVIGSGITTSTNYSTPGATGSSTRCYKIVARNKKGARSPASAETCIVNAQASEGFTTLNIATTTRSVQTVTMTTSTAHPLLVGCGVATCGHVYIEGTSNTDMRGDYTVTSAVNSTTFTYITNATVTNGAGTGSSGGTATFYPVVHLTWTQLANAWEYLIYEGASNAETLIDVSAPSDNNIATSYDDTGSTMTAGITTSLPADYPSTPQSTASGENLSTTVTAGGGSTTLTIANAASTAITGATVRLTIGPALLAAATAVSNLGSVNHGGPVYIPADNSAANPFLNYVLNDFQDLHALNFVLNQTGPLYLNETLEMAGGAGGISFSWHGDRLPEYGGNFGSGNALPHPIVTVGTAKPGVYMFQGGPSLIEGLAFQGASSCTNGVLLFLADGGFRPHFFDNSFTTCPGTTDFMSTALWNRGVSNGSQPTDIILRGNTFAMASNSTNGQNPNPSWLCTLCGTADIGDTYAVNRGFMYTTGSVGYGIIHVTQIIHYNGGFNPMFTVYTPGTNLRVDLGIPLEAVMDTVGTPCVASLGSFPATVVGTCSPGNNVGEISGQAVISQNILNGTPDNSNSFSSGIVIGPNSVNNYDSVWLYSQHLAENKSFYANNPTTATPSCTVSGVGTIPSGTYTFKIIPVWQDGLEGTASSPSAGCTVNGSQAIVLTWTNPTPGIPQGVNIYTSSDGVNYNQLTTFASATYPATTATWTSGTGVTKIQTYSPRSGPTVMNVNGIYAPGLNLAGIGIAAPINTGTMLTNTSIGNVFDNFNRAALNTGGPCPSGSCYTTGATLPTLSGNQAISGNTPGTGYDAVFTAFPISNFPNGQYAQAVVTGDIAATSNYRLRLDQNASGSASYLCQYENGATNGTIIYKGNGVSYTALTQGTFALADNDIIRCEAISNSTGTSTTLNLKRNGTVELTTTDGSPSTTPIGAPGFQMTPGTAVTMSIDDWEAGNINPTQAQVDTEQSWPQPQHFQQAITIGNEVPVAGSLGTGIYSSDLAPNSSICTNSVSKLVTTGCAGGSISGMVAGQVAIAGSASSITSSKPIQGSDTNILSSSTVTAGAGNSLCTDTGSGATTTGCPTLSGMTTGQVPIAASATTVTSTKALQGTDTNILSSGTVSGTGATLCTDANGGATTTGCTGGSISGLVAGQIPVAGTTTTITSSKPQQGTDADILTAGTFTGPANSLICTSANGGATNVNCSVYNTQSAATNNNIAATNMVASAPANTMYLYMWTISLTTAGTSCTSSTTVVLNVIFTDPSAAGTVTESLGQITIAPGGNGTVGFVAQGVDNIYAKSGTAVQYSTSGYTAGTGCSVNPSYQVTMRLQPMS